MTTILDNCKKGNAEMKKIKDLMVKNVKTCRTDTNLAEAVALMWDVNCGILPVVDAENRVIGLLTDRDISIAVGTRAKLASDIKTDEVISGNIYYCSPEDQLVEAMEIMKANKVHRLPVLDHDKKLLGIISLSDIALNVEETKGKESPEISFKDIALTLKGICEQQSQRARAAS
jgi:CBS domain-containing protein